MVKSDRNYSRIDVPRQTSFLHGRNINTTRRTRFTKAFWVLLCMSDWQGFVSYRVCRIFYLFMCFSLCVCFVFLFYGGRGRGCLGIRTHTHTNTDTHTNTKKKHTHAHKITCSHNHIYQLHETSLDILLAIILDSKISNIYY